jgi:phytoene synthase
VTEYRDWPQLEQYCQGVAGSVGEMCNAVFGVAGDARPGNATVVSAARTPGVAMQLTNILRDVGEDARRGRCYIPVNDLRRQGLDPQMVITGRVRLQWDAWRVLMACQVDRARDLYQRAVPAIRLLQVDSQGCAAVTR